MCELIGFFAWYNQKILTNGKSQNKKTVKNCCVFYSSLLLLKAILNTLGISNKKIEKTQLQIKDAQTQLTNSIAMTPYLTIESTISKIYDNKMLNKLAIPLE